MDDPEIISYNGFDLSNAMLVTAFPTIGLTSSIAGRFIIDILDLEEIGTIMSDDLMPATVIHKRHPSPPIRIYGGTQKCGQDGECEQVAIIISEFMPPAQMIKELTNKIFSWTDEKDIKLIVCLEGMLAGDQEQKNNKIYGVGSNKKMQDLLDSYDVELTNEGMITGVTGVLLYQGSLIKRDVVCLLAEAHSKFPDSRAAANLVEKLDIMIPGIKIDPEPLYKEADRIEKEIRKMIEQAKTTAPSMKDSTEAARMYA